MSKKNLILSAAVAGLITAAATTAFADDVKCYGIAKAGMNACASATGAHGCKGQGKIDNDAGDFVLSASDATCTAAGGKITPPAKK